jgi:hypothetical protein
VAVILLAALAFARGRLEISRKWLWFFAGITLVAILWALGGNTPFYRLVYAIVPGTKFFRAPSTMLYVVSFGVAVLAAFGAERAVYRDVNRRYLIGWAVVVLAIGVIGAVGGLTNLGVTVADPTQTNLVLENDAAIRGGALRSTLFGAMALACLFLLSTRRIGREAGGYLLAGIVAVDLWSIERMYWRFSPPADVTFAADSAIAHIKADSEPGRVLTLVTQKEHGRDPFLAGDGLMSHRVRNVLGYHGNELGRYQLLGGFSERWKQIANPNFWHLMNIKWVLTDAEDLGVAGLTRVVGPVRNAYGTNVYVFQIMDPNPAAWIAPAIVKATDEEMLGTVLDPRFDVRRAALFDTASTVNAVQLQSLPEGLPINVKTTRFDPGAIDVELDQPAPAGSALIVSENYYPGWSATADGKPATIGRADMTLIGVELPAGARKIELRFSSKPYETGKTITLFALMLAIAWWIGGAVYGKVRRA